MVHIGYCTELTISRNNFGTSTGLPSAANLVSSSFRIAASWTMISSITSSGWDQRFKPICFSGWRRYAVSCVKCCMLCWQAWGACNLKIITCLSFYYQYFLLTLFLITPLLADMCCTTNFLCSAAGCPQPNTVPYKCPFEFRPPTNKIDVFVCLDPEMQVISTVNIARSGLLSDQIPSCHLVFSSHQIPTIPGTKWWDLYWRASCFNAEVICS